ncbi:MAG: threonine synthase [Bacteroidales bacterium]|nr:threonine synthase [Bacteroidales bacterium]
MKYYSTKDRERLHPFSLKDAAFAGLAPDGGLFIPEYIPQVDMAKVEALAEKSYADMAVYLAQTVFDDIPAEDMDRLVRDAYNFPIVLNSFAEGLYNLELFHGPTYAFKDFGARFMGRMLGYLGDGQPIIILAATSGDTGSAVAHGFYGVDNVKVVILYPDGKVSPLQEAQMTTLGGNVSPLKVAGNFDDCQRLVKTMFNDRELREQVRITSANSINLLRWLPQSFYYFYAYCQWKKQTGASEPVVVVPSGNYGNLAAGMFAKRMGLPIKGFVAASNANDVVPEYLLTGEYRPRASVRTVANAMDVGAPSNFERMLWMCGDSYSNMTSEIKGFSCSDGQILDAIREIYEKYGYVSDPHSAVGYLATRHYGSNGFWLSTAHAAKFTEIIQRAVGITPDLPSGLALAMGKERCFTKVSADASRLADYLKG